MKNKFLLRTAASVMAALTICIAQTSFVSGMDYYNDTDLMDIIVPGEDEDPESLPRLTNISNILKDCSDESVKELIIALEIALEKYQNE